MGLIVAARVSAERGENLGDDAFGVEARLRIHRLGLVLVAEDVRKDEGANLEPVIEPPALRQGMENLSAKPANRAFLDRDQNLVIASELLQQFAVERLGEPGVGHGRGQAEFGEFVGGLQAFLEPRA